MGDDLQANLSTYKLQLQQVEASLTTDPENEDLLKLRKDLQEVIELTIELIGSKQPSIGEAVASTSHQAAEEDEEAIPQQNWKVGDECMALWSQESKYYPAVIEEILDDGSCTVTFEEYQNTEVTEVALLKPTDPNRKQGEEWDGGPDAKKAKSKKDLIAEQREYKRKKNLKKAQRWKQIEEERETEKYKWLNFNSKTFSKTKKGFVKKSIFRTPENDKGRVGVGTCGQSGRPMTRYTHQEKWKK